MSNPLPPIALSPAALGALQARPAAPRPGVAPEQDAPPKPAPADAPVRRGQYLDIVV
ncbi:MAG TPA: hypothetical protein VMU06_07320 [Stellaceae bacterium]|nr:hypothetical protein [Stellaceae bacterium]